LRIADCNKGYYYFRSGDAEDTDNYAVMDTLKKIEAVARKWSEAHPELMPLDKNLFTRADNGEGRGMRFGVGDLSARGGGECNYVCTQFNSSGVCIERGLPFQFERRAGRGAVYEFTYLAHNTHEAGLDVDVRYVRNDGQEARVDFNSTNNYYNQSVYSYELTRQLIDMFIDYGAKLIYVDYVGRAGFIHSPGGLTTITTANGNTATVQGESGHYHHFHVTFPVRHLPAGTIAISATPETIPADGQATTTISTNVIRDDLGGQLLEYTALDVETTSGVIVSGDAHPTRAGHQIRTDAGGRIGFVLRSATTAGTALITIRSIGGTAVGTKEITFTNPNQ
jgi:hypothetical protein